MVNIPPRQIADFLSEVLVPGVDVPGEGVTLLNVAQEAPLGSRVY